MCNQEKQKVLVTSYLGIVYYLGELTSNGSVHYFHHSFSKFQPWSGCSSRGSPNRLTMFLISTSTTVLASWLGMTEASTHFTKWSITTKMYLFPSSNSGYCPEVFSTNYTSRLSTFYCFIGPLLAAHVVHLCHNSLTSVEQ